MDGKRNVLDKHLSGAEGALPADARTVRQALIVKLKGLREELEESEPLLEVHLSAGYLIWDVLEMIDADPVEMVEVLGKENFQMLRSTIDGECQPT